MTILLTFYMSKIIHSFLNLQKLKCCYINVL
nr:MAG TPA: hypothetical protein [Caudoviricetes sp.]